MSVGPLMHLASSAITDVWCAPNGGRTDATEHVDDATCAACLQHAAAFGDECRVRLRAIIRQCGHAGAKVRNCPYAADVHDNMTERCECCDACAHECGMDI